MLRVKYALKWLLAQLLYRSGAFHAWVCVCLRNKAVVLTYHRVLDDDARRGTWSHPAIVVSPESFNRQLVELKRLFRVLSLADFEDAILNKGFREPSCLITFDDGWWDTCALAWPALERVGLPAAVFVPMDYIGTAATFWQERLGHVLYTVLERSRTDSVLEEHARVILREMQFGDVAVGGESGHIRDEVVARLRDLKRDVTFDPAAALQRLEELLPELLPLQPVDRFMTREELGAMATGHVAFGCHGESHRILTRLPPAEVRREAQAPKAELERLLGTRVTAMSYPNGGWNPAVADAMREAGYALAFTMDSGLARGGDDPFAVRRVNIHDGVAANTPMFVARVLGLF